MTECKETSKSNLPQDLSFLFIPIMLNQETNPIIH